MIIRTNMADRLGDALSMHPPKLSNRELRRLENTKHSKGRQSPVVEDISIPEEVKVEPVIKEEVPVRVEIIEEKKETESAVIEQPVVEQDSATAEPGTAVVRSKVLDELNKKPKKKYKVISLGK